MERKSVHTAETNWVRIQKLFNTKFFQIINFKSNVKSWNYHINISSLTGRGAAMIIESLRLFYHIDCFKCSVCHTSLGDGLGGTDVRVRNSKLHCQNCYSSDDGVKFSCV